MPDGLTHLETIQYPIKTNTIFLDQNWRFQIDMAIKGGCWWRLERKDTRMELRIFSTLILQEMQLFMMKE